MSFSSLWCASSPGRSEPRRARGRATDDGCLSSGQRVMGVPGTRHGAFSPCLMPCSAAAEGGGRMAAPLPSGVAQSSPPASLPHESHLRSATSLPPCSWPLPPSFLASTPSWPHCPLSGPFAAQPIPRRRRRYGTEYATRWLPSTLELPIRSLQHLYLASSHHPPDC